MLREFYERNEEMKLIMAECSKNGFVDYLVQDSFLFKGNKFCIPQGSFRKWIVMETHGKGLLVTLEIFKEYFYWPKMQGDV